MNNDITTDTTFAIIDQVELDVDDSPPQTRRKGAKAEPVEEPTDCEGPGIVEPTEVITVKRKATGPRGPLPHVAERREHVRKLIHLAAMVGPVTINEVVQTHGVHYYDVLWVAREEVVAGRLEESKCGRKSTFVLPGTEG